MASNPGVITDIQDQHDQMSERMLFAQTQITFYMDWINVKSIQLTFLTIFACHRWLKVEESTVLHFIGDHSRCTGPHYMNKYSTRSILWSYLKSCVYLILFQYGIVLLFLYVTSTMGPIPDPTIVIVYMMLSYTGLFMYTFRTFDIRTNIFLMAALIFFGLMHNAELVIISSLIELALILYTCNPAFGITMKISDLTSPAPLADKAQ